jgi:hypothetical protein
VLLAHFHLFAARGASLLHLPPRDDRDGVRSLLSPCSLYAEFFARSFTCRHTMTEMQDVSRFRQTKLLVVGGFL